MTNKKLAAIFYEIADVLEIKEVKWKPQAYRQAARAIEVLDKDVKSIYSSSGLKGLDEIPGVGKNISVKIEEYIKTGKISKHKELLKTMPAGFSGLLQVQGLGPKKIKLLLSKGITDIPKLKKALKSHKLIGEGFKEKTEENLEKGIGLLKTKRVPLKTVLPIANKIVNHLKKVSSRVVVAGSIRRKKSIVKDIDILAVSSNPSAVMDAFVKMKEVKRVLGKGKTKSSVVLNSGIQVDVRVVPAESFGAALHYFTGSKVYNIALRQIAIKKGLKLNEYGIFDKSGKMLAGKTEKEVCKILGVKYVNPEERETTAGVRLI